MYNSVFTGRNDYGSDTPGTVYAPEARPRVTSLRKTLGSLWAEGECQRSKHRVDVRGMVQAVGELLFLHTNKVLREI